MFGRLTATRESDFIRLRIGGRNRGSNGFGKGDRVRIIEKHRAGSRDLAGDLHLELANRPHRLFDHTDLDCRTVIVPLPKIVRNEGLRLGTRFAIHSNAAQSVQFDFTGIADDRTEGCRVTVFENLDGDFIASGQLGIPGHGDATR